jgi:signal transduction histidine kinase
MPRHKALKESPIESMKEIEAQASYINKIVADLQDYSRPLKPSSEEVNFSKLVEPILLSMEIEENVEVVFEVEDEIQNVKVDPAYLRRILTNLLINAEQVMPNGGTITITARKQKGDCFITIEDTGEGIPEDVKPNLFQPLFTTKAKG